MVEVTQTCLQLSFGSGVANLLKPCGVRLMLVAAIVVGVSVVGVSVVGVSEVLGGLVDISGGDGGWVDVVVGSGGMKFVPACQYKHKNIASALIS